MIPTVQILGVPIARLTVVEAVERALQGGLILAPSGPGLCDLARDTHYRDALLGSDLNLTDSGLLIVLEAVRSQHLLPRASGLGYVDSLLSRSELKAPGATYWVVPSEGSRGRTVAWLRARGFDVGPEDCYVAPIYPRRGRVTDPTLVTLLDARRPPHIFVCVGGGPQEKLGHTLKAALPYRPAIHCIGAAIAFLTGEQARIPAWADRLLLGWLIRCLHDPRTFVPRYVKAFRLVYLVLRYGAAAPPIPAAVT